MAVVHEYSIVFFEQKFFSLKLTLSSPHDIVAKKKKKKKKRTELSISLSQTIIFVNHLLSV